MYYLIHQRMWEKKSPPYINLFQNPVLPLELYLSLNYILFIVFVACINLKICIGKKKDCHDQIDLYGFHQKNDKGLKLFEC